MSCRETTADEEVKALQQKIARLERENQRLRERRALKERIAREWRNVDGAMIVLLTLGFGLLLLIPWMCFDAEVNGAQRTARATEAAVSFYRSPNVQVNCPSSDVGEDAVRTCMARSPGVRGVQAFRCSALRCEEPTW